MPTRDAILLETVKTHRLRLLAAFLFGPLAARRDTGAHVRRLGGGIVVAAVACAGCVGFSLVSSILASQAVASRAQDGQEPASGTPFAADTFDRTLASGWGLAETGGRWTVLGPPSAYAVEAGAGRLDVGPGAVRGGYLNAEQRDRSDVTATVLPSAGTGSAGTGARGSGSVDVELDVVGRRVSATEDYEAAVQIAADGATSLTLRRRERPTDVSTPAVRALSDTVGLLGSARPTGGALVPTNVRVQVVGSAPTTLRAKVWSWGASEPQDWTVTASDDSPALQRPGSVGMVARRGSDSTGVTQVSVLDLIARPVA